MKLDMVRDPISHRFMLRRPLLPGSYPVRETCDRQDVRHHTDAHTQYKLIVDDKWTYSADHPTIMDGENINNVLDVSERATFKQRTR